MNAVVRWIVPPRRKAIGIINAGIEVHGRNNGYSGNDIQRLQLGVEGVYAYCVRNIQTAGEAEEIGVSLSQGKGKVKVVIQHSGSGGEWDSHLKKDSDHRIRRTSFEALGLFIALEFVDSLIHDSQLDLTTGRNLKTYEMVMSHAYNESA